jgi:DNA topoisomerase-6 subunit B
LQSVGRKLGMYLRRRQRVKHEGERRGIFLRYLGEVATAVSNINLTDRDSLYERLLTVAKHKTAEADVRLNDRGKAVDEEEDLEDYGGNVIIVGPEEAPGAEAKNPEP